MTAMSGRRFLRLRTVRDAVLVPRRDHTDKAQGAGVLRSTPQGFVAVDGTGVRRRGREYVVTPPTEDVTPTRHIETAVFGGFLFEHYGHFMLESLGRLWAPASADHIPVVWLPSTGPALTAWQHDMLDLVEAPPQRFVIGGVDGPVSVGELLVADQGFEVRRYLHPWFSSFLGRIDATPAGDKVWLSRTGLGERSGVAEEPEVEALVAAAGWRVEHLEQHGVRRQAEILANASHVAGVEGSALHNLLFVRGFTGTIDVFTRQGDQSFEVIADAMGWDQTRHDLPGGVAEQWQRPSGFRDTRWSGVDASALVAALESSLQHRRLHHGG
jgi:hypothetical protein